MLFCKNIKKSNLTGWYVNSLIFYAQLWLERRSAWFQINLLGGPGLFITLMKSWHNILKPRKKKNWVIYDLPRRKIFVGKIVFWKNKTQTLFNKNPRSLSWLFLCYNPPVPAPLLSKTQNGKLWFRYLTLKFHLLCLI